MLEPGSTGSRRQGGPAPVPPRRGRVHPAAQGAEACAESGARDAGARPRRDRGRAPPAVVRLAAARRGAMPGRDREARSSPRCPPLDGHRRRVGVLSARAAPARHPVRDLRLHGRRVSANSVERESQARRRGGADYRRSRIAARRRGAGDRGGCRERRPAPRRYGLRRLSGNRSAQCAGAGEDAGPGAWQRRNRSRRHRCRPAGDGTAGE